MAVDRAPVRRPTLPIVLTIVLTLLVGTIFLWLRDTTPAINDTIGYVYAAARMAAGAGPTYADVHNAEIAPVFSMAAFQIQRDGSDLLYLGFPPGFGTAGRAHRLDGPSGRRPRGDALARRWRWRRRRCWDGTQRAVGGAAGGRRSSWPSCPICGGSAPRLRSDVPSMFVITLAAASSWPDASAREGSLALTVAAGLLLGYSIFLRYANVVVLPAFAAYDLWQARRHIFTDWKRYPFYAPWRWACLQVPAFNTVYYGGPLVTSYSPVHGWYPLPPFAWRYALGPSFIDGHSLIEMTRTVWRNLGFALILVPLGWARLARETALLCLLAAGTTLALYSMYALRRSGSTAASCSRPCPSSPWARATPSARSAHGCPGWSGGRRPAVRWRCCWRGLCPAWPES
ncbi:MAG: hypothetical protein R2838_12725 [Caldilineaceae bacterium]